MYALVIALVLITLPALVVIVAGIVTGKPFMAVSALASIAFSTAPFFVGLWWWYRSRGQNPDPDKSQH